jgi:hypothetical protein
MGLSRLFFFALKVIAHPIAGGPLSLTVNASATHVGAALPQQLPDHHLHVQALGIFPQETVSQQRYSAFERELFPIYAENRDFRHLLAGREFAINIDHKPLTYAFSY